MTREHVPTREAAILHPTKRGSSPRCCLETSCNHPLVRYPDNKIPIFIFFFSRLLLFELTQRTPQPLKMADKEATVYIVDLGESMADCHNGRDESDLDFGMRYVWDKISTTVAASRKTWTIGFVGLNTDETNNPHDDEDLGGYKNISILQEISPMTMTELRELRSTVQPCNAHSGDAISAVVVAMGMINEFTKKLKYKRRIILVTNGEPPIDDDAPEEVAEKLNENNIELVVIGVDFDDPDYGFKEEDKSSSKLSHYFPSSS